jgi:hypothetical protein
MRRVEADPYEADLYADPLGGLRGLQDRMRRNSRPQQRRPAPSRASSASASFKARLLTHAAGLVVLAAAGGVLGLTRSLQGWAAIGLAWMLLLVLNNCRMLGGRELATALGLVVLTSALAFMVLTAPGVGVSPDTPAKPKVQTEQMFSGLRGLVGSCPSPAHGLSRWVGCVAGHLTGGHHSPTPTTTTRRHR